MWTVVTLGAACVPRNGIIGARTSTGHVHHLSIVHSEKLAVTSPQPVVRFQTLEIFEHFPEVFTRLTNQRDVTWPTTNRQSNFQSQVSLTEFSTTRRETLAFFELLEMQILSFAELREARNVRTTR